MLLAGLARDGGLYVPGRVAPPLRVPTRSVACAACPIRTLAIELLRPYVGDEIGRCCLQDDRARVLRDVPPPGPLCPLVQTGDNEFVLELFHGPTLAFKDVAMQLLARLMDHVLASVASGRPSSAPPSGDTGGAAIEAFAGRARSDVFILFPHGPRPRRCSSGR